MINKINDDILVSGTKAEICSELCLIISYLIEDETININDLFTIFEGVSKKLRGDFDE